MSRHVFRLSRRHRLALATTLSASLVSGVAWWVLDNFCQIQGEFDISPHPAQAWLLRFHGAAAMAALVVLGSLLPVHVLRAWRAKRNRRTGAGLLALLALQIATGYALYYADNPLREAAGQLHFFLGLSLPATLVLHIYCGRRTGKPQA